MVPPLGSLPNSLDSVLAYPLDDFFVTPFNSFKTVPNDFMEPYTIAMSRILKHLVDALESSGVDRERRLAIAVRWYAAGSPGSSPFETHEHLSSATRTSFA